MSQVLVGGVDNRVDILCGQIALNCLHTHLGKRNLGVVSGTLAAALLLVELGGIFGNASASGTRLGVQSIEIELSVEVTSSPSAVVAHLLAPGEQQSTVAMARTGDDDVFTGFVQVRPVDMVVVFEALNDGGVSVESRPTRLSELGVDPAVLGIVPSGLGSIDQATPGSNLWLVAVAAAVAALALGVVWFWMGMKSTTSAAEVEPPDVAEAAQPDEIAPEADPVPAEENSDA